MKKQRIVLASQSPRRKEILARMGFRATVIVSECEEDKVRETDPRRLVKELSRMKAEAVLPQCRPDDIIVAADTVVAAGGEILGKPRTEAEAAEMIRRISGKKHVVYTGVTVIRGRRRRTFAERSVVTVAELSEEEIADYVATGEPMDKAGAYGIQGRFCRHVSRVDGDFYNVMGLPSARTYATLKTFLGAGRA